MENEQPIGGLSVELSGDSRSVQWMWRPESGQTFTGPCTRLRVPLPSILAKVQSLWLAALQQSGQGQIRQANSSVQGICEYLIEQFVPRDVEDFLTNLGRPGDFLLVDMDTDCFPLELLLIEGEPFVVRYRTMHKKQLSELPTDCPRTTTSHAAQPRVCIIESMSEAIARALPDAQGQYEQQQMDKHVTTLQKIFSSFYVASGLQMLRDSSATVENMKQTLGSDYSLLYYLGHGGQTDACGTLQLADGILDSLAIESFLRSHDPGPKGLAFLNSCWSSATRTAGLPDVSKVLVAEGFQAVIGTALPPLLAEARQVADRFFCQMVKHKFDLLESLYAIQRWKWERFQHNPMTSNLAWACYRLYGTAQRRYLATSMTTDDGKLVHRDRYGILEFGSLVGRRSLLTPAELRRFVKLGQPTHEESWRTAKFIRALLSGPLRKSGKEWIRSILASGRRELLSQLVAQDTQEVLIRAEEIRREQGDERVDPGHLRRALEERATQDYSSPKSVEEIKALIAFDMSEGVVNIFADVLESSQGQLIECRDLLAMHEFIDPLGKVIDLVWGDKRNRNRVDIEMTLRLARWFARWNNKPKIDEFDVFQAALVQLCSGNAPGTGRSVAGWLYPPDLSDAPPGKEEFSSTAQFHLSIACLSQEGIRFHDLPFCWHVLKSCCAHDYGSLLKKMKAIGLDPFRLWKIVENLLEAGRGRPILSRWCRGAAVGTGWRVLPHVGQEHWNIQLKTAARQVARDERHVILVLPWNPSETCKASQIMNEVICSTLMDLTCEHTQSSIHERAWMHLPAMELLDAMTVCFVRRRIFGGSMSVAVAVQHTLGEAEEQFVLCLRGLERWVGAKGRRPLKKATKVMARIKQQCIPTVFLVQRGDTSLAALCEAGLGDSVVELAPLDRLQTRSFLCGWGREFFPVGDARDFEDAVETAIQNAAQKEREDARLLRCMNLLIDAGLAKGKEDSWVRFVGEMIARDHPNRMRC